MNAIVSSTSIAVREQLSKEQFFDLALDMVCIAGSNGYLRIINSVWTQVLGWSEQEILSRPWSELVHVDDRQPLVATLQDLQPGQRAHRIECRCQHKDGSYRWLWVSATRANSSDDIIASARDITERKQTELREVTRGRTLSALASGATLPEVLRTLVDGVEAEHAGAFACIMLLDATGHFLQASMAPSLPDFYNAATQHLPIGPAVGSCGTAAFTGQRVITPDIQSDPAWVTARELAAKAGLAACCSQPIFDGRGNVLGTCAIYRSHIHQPQVSELTTLEAAAQLAAIAIERKNQEQALGDSEANYRRIVEKTSEGIWTVDESMKVTFANVQLATLLGYRPEEMLGRSLFDFFDDEARRKFAERLEQRRRGVSESYDYKLMHRDGHNVWVHISASPLANVDDKFIGAMAMITDITERKYAEDALREREIYLEKIINNIGDPVFVKNNDSRFMLVNDAFCTDFNLPRSDILGKTLGEALPADQMEKVFAVDRRVLDEGRDVSTEEVVVRGGQARTIYSKKTRYTDDAGNRFLIGVIHDLTEHKRMEQAIQANQARFQEIFGAMAAGLVVQSLDGSIIESNRAAEVILGMGADQLAESKSIEPRWRTLREDGSNFPPELSPTTMVLQSGQAQRNVVLGIYRPDNSLVWISVNAVPLHDDQKNMIGVVSSFSDVTGSVLASASLKQSEASMTAAQSRAKIGSWDMDLATLKGHWSAELYRIFGFNMAMGVPTRKEFKAALHPDDLEKYDREYVRAVSQGDGMRLEYRIVLADGSIRWLETRSELIVDEHGDPTSMTGTTQDITERHQLEAQFRQAQKMEAIGTLAGGIAHDFNNILAAIKGYTQLAKADAKDRLDVSEHLDAVLQGTLRATELVKQITTFSRQDDTERSPLQLHSVVGEALTLIRATIPATIPIVSKLAQDTPAVLADATQVHQIVMNLCTNAWHAMKARSGSIEVCVDLAVVDAAFAKRNPDLQPGNYVRLRVADEGMGIDVSTLARIFEPFFTTKPPGEGSGLGLAVVHGIMRSHQGAIIVNSVPKVGTQFELYFPIYTGGMATAATSSTPTMLAGSGERIFLVDDEPSLIRLSTQALERFGYKVKSFDSGAAALAVMKAAPDSVDLLITDISMPMMTGLELAHCVRTLRSNLPIIVVSGHVDALAQEQINALGIECLLPKPFSLESLGSAVNQLLMHKRKV